MYNAVLFAVALVSALLSIPTASEVIGSNCSLPSDLCKRCIVDTEGDEEKRFRIVTPATETCLKCDLDANVSSVKWAYIPSSGRNTSTLLPENACQIKENFLQLFQMTQYDNNGTYMCVDKSKQSRVLCIFRVDVRGIQEGTKRLDEGKNERIGHSYYPCVRNYQWFYGQSKNSPFERLVPNNLGKIDSPCQATILGTGRYLRFDSVTMACGGIYKIVAHSSRANFSVTQILNVIIRKSKDKQLSLTCPSASPILVHKNENFRYNCTGTFLKASYPSLTIQCRSGNGQTRWRKTWEIFRKSQSVSVDRFIARYEMNSHGNGMSVYLRIQKISDIDDRLYCSVQFASRSISRQKDFLLIFQSEKSELWLVFVIPVVICVVLVALVVIIYFRFELEIAFLWRRVRFWLTRNCRLCGKATVGENYWADPLVIILHGNSTAEAASDLCRALSVRLPFVKIGKYLSGGLAGGDRGDAIHQCLTDAHVAIVLMSTADIGCQPAVLEKALEQCLHQVSTTCIYLIMENAFRVPRQLHSNYAVMAKRLEADLSIFGRRDRRLKCNDGVIDVATVTKLVKRLRLLLPLWSLEAKRTHIAIRTVSDSSEG